VVFAFCASKFRVADDPGLSQASSHGYRVLPLFRHQNTNFRANWMERGPPIWYSGLKPPLAVPEPSPFASVCVERPNKGLVRVLVGEPRLSASAKSR